jgi:hypothetical protein
MGRKDVIRREDDGFVLSVRPDDRRVVVDLVAQLRDAILDGTGDERFRRLFPAAYHQDADLDEEYQRLMHGELLASRLDSLNRTHELLSRDADADFISLSEDEIDSLMKSVNDLRLVLGTLLDIQENEPSIDEDDPAYPQVHLYSYLGWLLEWIIRVRVGD